MTIQSDLSKSEVCNIGGVEWMNEWMNEWTKFPDHFMVNMNPKNVDSEHFSLLIV